MMSHTQGEWKVDESEPWNVIAGDLIFRQFTGPLNFSDGRMFQLPNEFEENAKLIAAAPKMLEALEAIAKLHSHEASTYEMALAMYDARCVALQAIKKAKGE